MSTKRIEQSYFESFGILYLTCDVYILHKREKNRRFLLIHAVCVLCILDSISYLYKHDSTRGQAPVRIRITFMSVYIILNANGSIEKRFGSKRYAIYTNIHSRAHDSTAMPVN